MTFDCEYQRASSQAIRCRLYSVIASIISNFRLDCVMAVVSYPEYRFVGRLDVVGQIPNDKARAHSTKADGLHEHVPN
jgi:hypothetical protein